MVRAAYTARTVALAQKVLSNTSFAGQKWLEPKKAFRPHAGLTSYEQRAKERAAMAAAKEKEKQMKEEKEALRQVFFLFLFLMKNSFYRLGS